ncbi:DUF2066 domain-containing protein [Parvularcula marina]|uniref:DUF2066 domain-containing protein n=1 Tax=Parvularcula marina TaxID=2292771 RepID=A0A371REY3_9PROT|nr:DUF2066 domain-containing protein [Parvularcula marina]RFB04006.1 DUF2066 domain-containing protein [Parvularcula marina]
MHLRRLLTVFALLLTWASAAHAQNSNRQVFIVPEVPVFAEADTAAAAQAIAQAQGRRVAMDILLRRLTAEEDWEYLPALASGQPAISGPIEDDPVLDPAIEAQFGQDMALDIKQPVYITPETLASFEEGFSIFDEKTSSTTYRARITYRFKPDAVRQALEDAGLPYSEAQARRALVLPVLVTENDTYLWETRNPWARAWLSRPLVNELTPLILPRGDRQDMANVTITEAANLNQAALGEMANRYQTPQVILARGRLQHTADEYLLSVQLIDAYLDGRSGNRQRIESETDDPAARLYDSEDGYGTDGVGGGSSQSSGQVLAEAFFRGPDDDFPALAQRAVEATVARYADGWKAQTLVDHSDVRSLTLTAWFGGLDEWADIRIALESTPLVRKMEVGVFTNQSAVIDLLVIGQQEQFNLALKQENLTVWQSPDGRWNIADNARAAELQGQMQDVVYNPDEFSNGSRQNRNGLGVNQPGLNGPINAQAAPGTDVSMTGMNGAPVELELPDELFGEDEEPAGPPAGAPVALEPADAEDASDNVDNDGALR